MENKQSEKPTLNQEAEHQFRIFQYHGLAYCSALLLCGLVRLIWPEGWSFFWPMLIWSMFILIHYLFFRALNIDPEWVDERSQEITLNSTDLSHIQAIRDMHVDRTTARANSRKDNISDNDGSNQSQP